MAAPSPMLRAVLGGCFAGALGSCRVAPCFDKFTGYSTGLYKVLLQVFRLYQKGILGFKAYYNK